MVGNNDDFTIDDLLGGAVKPAEAPPIPFPEEKEPLKAVPAELPKGNASVNNFPLESMIPDLTPAPVQEVVAYPDTNFDDVAHTGLSVQAPVQAPVQMAPVQMTPMVAPLAGLPMAPAQHTQMIQATGGITKISFGEKVEAYPIERFKASKGFKSRISIISKDIMAVKVHYHEETGYFYCFGTSCCQMLGIPGLRYIFPVVVYNTDKNGNPINIEFAIKYLSVNQSVYDDFIDIDSAQGIIGTDFIVNCTDEGYQKNTYNNIGEALWVKHPQFKQLVAAEYTKAWPFVEVMVAKRMKDVEFLRIMKDVDEEARLLAGQSNNPASEPLNIDAFFKQ